jgi:Sel1 repeat
MWVQSRFVLAAGAAALVVAIAGQPAGAQRSEPETLLAAAPSGMEYQIVDCLLSGQVRRVGSKMTYMTPRRALKTTAGDCETRGGEYVAFDRADYRTALMVWQQEADGGSAEAQYQVGEIYERGLGTQPNYMMAAAYYRKAADQGFSKAAVNLGRIYEQGLLGSPDLNEAGKWYQKALGLSPDAFERLQKPEMERLQGRIAEQEKEIGQLRGELDRLNKELQGARGDLRRRSEEITRERGKLDQARREVEQRKLQLAALADADARTELEKTSRATRARLISSVAMSPR